ncbi:MAG: phosphate ABC transporter substrate-binding protein PstS [Chloroflexota bacterium]|nr:phosphate ABC transporter substrate-binding protein PstS [Chloroflexota bacterium]
MENANRVVNRRRVLFGIAGAAGTAILAACGGSATSTPAPAPPAATTSAAGAAATATKAPAAATTSTGATTGSTAAATSAPAATTAASSAVSGSAALAQPTFGAIAGGSNIQLTGAGSTFINPLLTTWADVFKQKVANNVSINYQSIGSGGGIQQITQKTVDFGASDAPLTDAQVAAAPGILHIPMVHGPVVATYNLKLDVNKPLQFSGQTLVDIYFGTITKWNDKAIAADNPGIQLPTTDIAVVYRSDGSGTTSIWVDYLSKISTDWESKVGRGTSVKFPTGIGAKGNEGVSGQVKQVEGGIGYVELAYAIENKLPLSLVKNAAGEFIAPSIDSASRAAALPSYPADLRFSITNPPAEVKGAYPITGTTWLLAYTNETDMNKTVALVDFIRWAISPAGDEVAKSKVYPSIPAPLKEKVLGQLQKIMVNGTPVYK